MPNRNLLEPEYSFRLAERNVASEYDSFASSKELDGPDPRSFIESSAVLLELLLLGACTYEIVHELGGTPAIDSGIAAQIRDRCGIVLEELALDVSRYLPVQQIEASRLPPISISRVLRVVGSVLELCPITDLESIGVAAGHERFSHRARVAYEALRSFLLRNDPRNKKLVGLVGAKYSAGMLSTAEIATLLDIDPSEAAFTLEELGFTRSLDRTRLSDSERARILSQIRMDRLSRAGKVEFDADFAARDAIASERLEEVDARQWIPRVIN